MGAAWGRIGAWPLACCLTFGTVLALSLFWALASISQVLALFPALVVGLVWTGEVAYLLQQADGSAEASVPPIGLANGVTMVRGGLYAVVAGFVFVPPGTPLDWVPAGAYGVGVLLDKLDGSLARTVGTRSALGERLDMAFDAFGLAVAPLVAVLWGLLPVWYLSLSAARYVFRAGVLWRQARGLPVRDLPESDLRQYLAAFQMVFVTVALVPQAPTPLVKAVAPFAIAPSLGLFVRDYAAVVGWLDR